MQLQKTDKRTVFKSDDFNESVMDMDASGMAFATHYLRDKIYSDKQLAVIREYTANALDEHQKFRVLEPVEISLPTTQDPNFSVRDYGKGLDDEGVRKIFGRYFKSTKNQKNADGKAAVGGFGIGSKSGHAYADQFSVVSIHKGTKRTYICPLEGMGEMAVGKIMEIDSTPTTEPSGITITVPVKQGDEYNFAVKTRKLLQHLPKGMSVKVKEGDQEEVVSHPTTYTVSGTAKMGTANCFWYLGEGGDHWNQHITVVVGFVPYQVKSHVRIDKMLSGAVIYVSPDDINVALSREDLEFTDETIRNLQKALDDIRKDITEKAIKEIRSHSDLKAAFLAYQGLNHSLKREQSVRTAFDKDLDFFSINLNPSLSSVNAVVTRNAHNLGGEEYTIYTRSKGKHRCNSRDLGNDDARIVVYEDGTRYSLRAKDMVEKNPKINTFVLIGKGSFDKFLSDIDTDPYSKTAKKVLEYLPTMYSSITLKLEDYDKEVKTRAQRGQKKQEKYLAYQCCGHLYKHAKTDTEYTDIVNVTNASNYVIALRETNRMIKTDKRSYDTSKVSRTMIDELKKDGKTLVVLNTQAWRDLKDKFQHLCDWEDNHKPVLSEEDKRKLFWDIYFNEMGGRSNASSAVGLCKKVRDVMLPASARKIIHVYKLSQASSRHYDTSALRFAKNRKSVTKDVEKLVSSISLYQKANPFLWELAVGMGQKYPEKVIDIIQNQK